MNKGGLKKVHNKRNLEGLEIGGDCIDVTGEKDESVISAGKQEVEEIECDGEPVSPVIVQHEKRQRQTPVEIPPPPEKKQVDWDEWRQFMSEVVIKRSYFIIPERKNRAGYMLRERPSIRKIDSSVIRRNASTTQILIEDLCMKGIIELSDKNKILNTIEELVKSSLGADKHEMQMSLNYITKIRLKMTNVKNDYYDKARKEHSNGDAKGNGNSKKKHKA